MRWCRWEVSNVQLPVEDCLIFYVRPQSFDLKLIYLFLILSIVIENDCSLTFGLSFPVIMIGTKIRPRELLFQLSLHLCFQSLFSSNGDLVCTTQSTCDTLEDLYLPHGLNSLFKIAYINHGKMSSGMSRVLTLSILHLTHYGK